MASKFGQLHMRFTMRPMDNGALELRAEKVSDGLIVLGMGLSEYEYALYSVAELIGHCWTMDRIHMKCTRVEVLTPNGWQRRRYAVPRPQHWYGEDELVFPTVPETWPEED